MILVFDITKHCLAANT